MSMVAYNPHRPWGFRDSILQYTNIALESGPFNDNVPIVLMVMFQFANCNKLPDSTPLYNVIS